MQSIAESASAAIPNLFCWCSNLVSTGYSAHSIGIVSKKTPALDIFKAIRKSCVGRKEDGTRDSHYLNSSRHDLTLVAQSSESLLACGMNQPPMQYLSNFRKLSQHTRPFLRWRLSTPCHDSSYGFRSSFGYATIGCEDLIYSRPSCSSASSDRFPVPW